jgi:hypothetical protein
VPNAEFDEARRIRKYRDEFGPPLAVCGSGPGHGVRQSPKPVGHVASGESRLPSAVTFPVASEWILDFIFQNDGTHALAVQSGCRKTDVWENGRENLEIGQKPISNPKSEILNWTRNGEDTSIQTARRPGSPIYNF